MTQNLLFSEEDIDLLTYEIARIDALTLIFKSSHSIAMEGLRAAGLIDDKKTN